MKIQQKKIHGPVVRVSGETNTPPSWLVRFAWDRLRGWRRQTYKKRKPRCMEVSPLGSAHPLSLRVYYPLLAE